MLWRNFILFIRKEQPTFLGRWRLEECIQKRNNKIDWANEDHCGTCFIKLKKCGEELLIKSQAKVTHPLSTPVGPTSKPHQ
jgi:hypothetical protein